MRQHHEQYQLMHTSYYPSPGWHITAVLKPTLPTSYGSEAGACATESLWRPSAGRDSSFRTGPTRLAGSSNSCAAGTFFRTRARIKHDHRNSFCVFGLQPDSSRKISGVICGLSAFGESYVRLLAGPSPIPQQNVTYIARILGLEKPLLLATTKLSLPAPSNAR